MRARAQIATVHTLTYAFFTVLTGTASFANMSKLFIGCDSSPSHGAADTIHCKLMHHTSGLAWHTDDQTLRSKFEEFGQVQEAVRIPHSPLHLHR